MQILLLSLICLSGVAAEIKLFCDWAWDAKGQTMFPLLENTPDNELPLPSRLRRELNSLGHEIRSWEIEEYRPWLTCWKGVKNYTDFKHWLGIGLTRKKPIASDNEYWMFWNLGPKLKDLDFSKVPKDQMILMMWEPPTVQKELYDPKIQAHFGRIFTWDDDLVDNKLFFKFHYPVLTTRIANIPPFEEKKFCVMICRHLKSKHPKELYSKRRQVIQFFEDKPGELDLYGFYWEREKYKNWKGPLLGNKLDKLKEYKFSICYENMSDVKGYITEKIFDCFAAGVVPIYWGASNVTAYIPPSCFIDRRNFANNEEMYLFLKSMNREDYQSYLDSAGTFLKSNQAQVFSTEYFVKHLLLDLREDR